MSLKTLSDSDLLASFKDLVVDERLALVSQLDHLLEMDRRKLYLGYSSLWACLVHEHGLEDSAAERKIRAARLLGRFPVIRSGLESGKLNLSLLELAMGCASREKFEDSEYLDLIEAISGLSVQAARRKIASRYPSVEIPHDRIRPLTEELSEVRFVANQELLDQLEEIRGLLAHAHPKLSLAKLIGILAAEYRERHHPEAKARRAQERAERRAESPSATKVPEPSESPSSTKVPEARFASQPLRHELTLKDGYVCSYIDPMTGRRCTSMFALEIDHRQAWANGGKTELRNLRYLCRGHHARVSYLEFGGSARYSARET